MATAAPSNPAQLSSERRRPERNAMLQNVQDIALLCQDASSSLTHKVYSLNSTVLCWAASQEDPAATAALMHLITATPATFSGE